MVKRLFFLWAILLAITGLITCWFAGQAIRQGWKYFRLNAQVPATALTWQVKMLSSSHYALFATYRYSVDGQACTGETLLSSPIYPNQYAAELDLKERREKPPMRVWYQKKAPSFSCLQKRFPKKELINTLLTFGVFLYFYFARGLMNKGYSDIAHSKQV